MKVFRAPRKKNHEVDLVVKLAASKMIEMTKGAFIKTMKTLYTERMVVCTIEERKDWQTPMIKYYRDDILLHNPKKAIKVVRWFSRYAINASYKMYRRSFSQRDIQSPY